MRPLNATLGRDLLKWFKNQEMCKRDSYAKFHGATHHRFFAIFEEPPGRIPASSSVLCLILEKSICMVFHSLSLGREAPVINVKTEMKSETQALSGGLQITH